MIDTKLLRLAVLTAVTSGIWRRADGLIRTCCPSSGWKRWYLSKCFAGPWTENLETASTQNPVDNLWYETPACQIASHKATACKNPLNFRQSHAWHKFLKGTRFKSVPQNLWAQTFYGRIRRTQIPPRSTNFSASTACHFCTAGETERRITIPSPYIINGIVQNMHKIKRSLYTLWLVLCCSLC